MAPSSVRRILKRGPSGDERQHATPSVPGAARKAPRSTDDLLTAHLEIERGAPFCANPECALHVRRVDVRVAGGGNWVTLPDGRVFGRSRFGAALLCDACGTARGPVRLAAGRAD